MSAFLGPIHYWLYRKIQFQEGLTAALVELAGDSAEDLHKELDQTCGAREVRELEDVIDTGNIHGWLQERISIAESRFALAVKRLLDKTNCEDTRQARISELSDAAYAYGATSALDANASATDAFRALNDMLLEGMPCDRVMEPGKVEPDHVVWRQARDLHEDYWRAQDAEYALYSVLRDACIRGVLSTTQLEYSHEGDTFEVKVNHE